MVRDGAGVVTVVATSADRSLLVDCDEKGVTGLTTLAFIVAWQGNDAAVLKTATMRAYNGGGAVLYEGPG